MDDVGPVAGAHLAERLVVGREERELGLAALVDVRLEGAVLAAVGRVLVPRPLEDLEVARLLLDRRMLLGGLARPGRRTRPGGLGRVVRAAGREDSGAGGERAELEKVSSPEPALHNRIVAVLIVLVAAHPHTSSGGPRRLTDPSVSAIRLDR